jgi:hypothetical protein
MGKHSSLRIISVIFKVLAVVAVIVGAIAAIGNVSYFAAYGVWAVVTPLIYGVVFGLYFFAFSGIILVFLDIEESTRRTEENTKQTEINTHQANELLKTFLNRPK